MTELNSPPNRETPPCDPNATGQQCANCGESIAASFCAVCGQRTDVRALSVRSLLGRFCAELTSFEQPLLRTLRGVMRHPGRVATEYVQGRRVRYSNPIKWALLSTGFAFLAGNYVGGRNPVHFEVGESDSMPAWVRTLFESLASNAAPLFVLLLLPFLACTMRLCFRGTGRTFAEELVLVLFAYGAAALLQIAYAGIVLLGAPPNLGGPLPLIWTAWAAVSFHPSRSGAVSVLLVMLAHALWILSIGGLAGVAFLISRLF